MVSDDAFFYLQMILIRLKISWSNLVANPVIKWIVGFIKNNFGVLLFTSAFLAYHLKYRSIYFLDKDNKTLHSLTYLQSVDKKIRSSARWLIQDQCFYDPRMVDFLARLSLRMVLEDDYTKKTTTDIFIEMLKGPMFNAETRKLMEWAVTNWLKSEYGLRQMRLMLTKEIMSDQTYILPNMY